MNKYYSSIIAVLLLSFLCQCRSKVREQKDELYSRYLQKKIALTIYNTPVPDNKADFNLLLLNDGTAFDKLNLKDLLKTMVQQKDIAPLIVISFHVDSKYYGVVGDGKVIDKNRDAEKFQDFLVKELIPFAKKKPALGSSAQL